MNANTIYSKSILDMGELANRKLKLSQSMPNVLTMVDNTQTQQKIAEVALKMGTLADSFQQLLSMELIAPTEFGFTPPVQPIKPVQPSSKAPAPNPRIFGQQRRLAPPRPSTWL